MEQQFYSKFGLSVDFASINAAQKSIENLSSKIEKNFGFVNRAIGLISVGTLALVASTNKIIAEQSQLATTLGISTTAIFQQQVAFTALGSSLGGVLGELKQLQTAKFEASEFGNVDTDKMLSLSKIGSNYSSSLETILSNSLKIQDSSKMYFLLQKAVGTEVANMALKIKTLNLDYKEVIKQSARLNFLTKEQADSATLFTFQSRLLYGGLKSFVASLSAEVAKRLNPGMERFLKNIVGSKNQALELATKLSGAFAVLVDYVAKTVEYIALIVSKVAQLVGGYDNLARVVTIFGGLALSIKAVTTAIKLLSVAMSPWFLALSAIAFVVDDIIVSFKGGDSLLNWVEIFNSLKIAFTPVIDAFSTMVKDIMPSLKEAFSTIGGAIDELLPLLKPLSGLLLDIFSKALVIAIEAVSLAIKNIVSGIKIISKLFKGDFSGAWGEVKNGLSNTTEFVSKQVDRVSGAVSSSSSSTTNNTSSNTNNTANNNVSININTSESSKEVMEQMRNLSMAN